MILMCETKDTQYQFLGNCIGILSKIFKTDFRLYDKKLIHSALCKCNWLPKYPTSYFRKTDNQYINSVKYHIGYFNKFINNKSKITSEFIIEYYDLKKNLEESLGIKLFGVLDEYFEIEEIENNIKNHAYDKSTQVEEPWDETNMEFCNQQLLDKYQTESKKTIKITEEQLLKLKNILNEGVEWSNDNGKLNLKVNSSSLDKDNTKGRGYVDTRVFGKPSDILYGDGTYNYNRGIESAYKSVAVKHGIYRLMYNAYKNNWSNDFLAKYVKDTYGLDIVGNKMLDKYNEHIEDGTIENWLLQSLNRTKMDLSARGGRYNRVKNDLKNSKDKSERYISSVVPGTDVKYIALYYMTDFNFSDAIKHGVARANPLTTSVGIPTIKNPENKRKTLPIEVSYDNNVTPDIENNFSLPSKDDAHFKKQYTNKSDYTSVTQFMDKSIMYAAHVLNKIGFIPDYIVTAPSSSKFNQYYATNLSNKLNVPFVQNFFQRNLVNVKFEEGAIEEMEKSGFTKEDIFSFESQLKNVAFNEISNIIFEPIVSVLHETNIDDSFINDFKHLAWYTISNVLIQENKPTIARKLCDKFFKVNNESDSNNSNKINDYINSVIGKRRWNAVLQQSYNFALKYCDVLANEGYKINFNSKFKITKFEKRFRPFLKNVYVVADSELYEGKFQKRYENAKFLIFDEDINSGATLRLLIDALQENTLNTPSSNILCLVNGYSNSGF